MTYQKSEKSKSARAVAELAQGILNRVVRLDELKDEEVMGMAQGILDYEAELARLIELSNPLLFLQGYEMACRDRDKSQAAILAEREELAKLIYKLADKIIAEIRARPAP